MREKVRAWLQENVSDLGVVSSAFIFGSFLDAKNTYSDVDVVIIFQNWENRQWMAKLKSQFSEIFGIGLHIQGFHLSQEDEILKFKMKASVIEEIQNV